MPSPLAFIFAARADRAAAAACAGILRRQGWHPLIIADAAEAAWPPECQPDFSSRFPRAGRMRGTECAAGICRLMARVDGHPVRAKIDADTRLAAAASAWLAACQPEEARGFGIARHEWSGIWAAHRQRIGIAARLLEKAVCPACPEARLIPRALAAANTTLTTHPAPLRVWLPGRPLPADAAAITLPTSARGPRRADAAAAMFAAPF